MRLKFGSVPSATAAFLRKGSLYCKLNLLFRSMIIHTQSYCLAQAYVHLHIWRRVILFLWNTQRREKARCLLFYTFPNTLF